MDKERLMKEASEFINEGDGYIHSEMKGGKSPKIIIGGDTLAILWQVCGIITRVCEISGTSWEQTCGLVFNYPSAGYRKVKSMTKDCEKKVYVGSNWNEQWKKDQMKKMQREASIESIGLAVSLKAMEEKNASLNNQLIDLKKQNLKIIKAKDEQILKLSKECQELEHRLKEMEEQRLFPIEKGNK